MNKQHEEHDCIDVVDVVWGTCMWCCACREHLCVGEHVLM